METQPVIHTLENLNTETIYRFRFGKHGETAPQWTEWKNGQLRFVIRRTSDLPKSIRNRSKFWKKGDLLTLVASDEWPCEYGPQDYHGNGFFDCEEWCLEIANMN